MAFPLLLQVGAVPFVTNSENSILARRANGRSNQPRSHGITSNATTFRVTRSYEITFLQVIKKRGNYLEPESDVSTLCDDP